MNRWNKNIFLVLALVSSFLLIEKQSVNANTTTSIEEIDDGPTTTFTHTGEANINSSTDDQNSNFVNETGQWDSSDESGNYNSSTVTENSASSTVTENSDSSTITENSNSSTVTEISDSSIITENSASSSITENSDSSTLIENSDSSTVAEKSNSSIDSENSDLFTETGTLDTSSIEEKSNSSIDTKKENSLNDSQEFNSSNEAEQLNLSAIEYDSLNKVGSKSNTIEEAESKDVESVSNHYSAEILTPTKVLSSSYLRPKKNAEMFETLQPTETKNIPRKHGIQCLESPVTQMLNLQHKMFLIPPTRGGPCIWKFKTEEVDALLTLRCEFLSLLGPTNGADDDCITKEELFVTDTEELQKRFCGQHQNLRYSSANGEMEITLTVPSFPDAPESFHLDDCTVSAHAFDPNSLKVT